MRREQFGELITRLGPVLDPLGIAAFPDANAWGIAIADDLSILVDLAEDRGKVVLSCDVGVPPSGERGALYELLLRHNYHWDQTGGVRLALDEADGGIVQLVDLATDGLDVPRLANAVQVFAAAARAWREIVSRPQPSRDLTLDDSNTLMIRI